MGMADFSNRVTALCVVLGLTAATFGQPARTWTRFYGLTVASNTTTVAVKTDSVGNVFWAKVRNQRGVDGRWGPVELTKCNASGNVLWTRSLLGSGSGASAFLGLVVDKADNVVVAQYDLNSLVSNQGPVLTKLNGASGGQLWSVVTPQRTSFTAFNLATDSSNNIVVGGLGAAQNGDPRIGVTRHNGATGAVLWTKTLARAAANFADSFSDLATDASGNVLVVGTTRVDNPCDLDNPAAVLMGKMRASDGSVLWTQTYTSGASHVMRNPMVRVDQSNNVLIGATSVRAGLDAWVVLKRAYGTGAALYTRVFQQAGFDFDLIEDFDKDSSGGVAAAGNASDTTGSGVFVLRLTNGGAVVWTRMLRDRETGNSAPLGARVPRLALVSNTSVIVANTRVTSPTRPTSMVIATRINATSGATVWERLYNGAGSSETSATTLSVTGNGDAYVGAEVETGLNDNPVLQPGIAKFRSADGLFGFTKLGTNNVDGSADFGQALVVDGNGNSYGTGTSAGRMVTVKVNSSGNVLWQNTYENLGLNVTSGLREGGQTIVRDLDGNIIVAGTNRGNVVVQKIGATTGGTIWSRLFDGELGKKIAVDNNGNVFVPFVSPSRVLKLNGGSGNAMWTGVVNGPGVHDESHFVAVDAFGNAVISGKTYNDAVCPDPTPERILVAKLNGATGVQLWSKQMPAPLTGRNEPVGIAVDGGGAVLVAGTSANSGSYDYFAAKLFGTNGDTIWAVHHDNQSSWDEAAAMIVDDGGNLIVTGYSNDDGWTVKLAATTGVQLWSNLATTPTGLKTPTDVALDGAGNVYVGGYLSNTTLFRQYGQKIFAGNGNTAWVVQISDSVSASQKVSVGVTTDNRLTLFGSTTSYNASLANYSFVRFNP